MLIALIATSTEDSDELQCIWTRFIGIIEEITLASVFIKTAINVSGR